MNFVTFCLSARAQLLGAGFNPSQVQALELGAALLGYRTYATLTSDVGSDEVFTLAEHVILQRNALALRMCELNLASAKDEVWFKAFATAADGLLEKADRGCRVHYSMFNFYEFASEHVEDQAFIDAEVLDAYAGMNASVDEFYVHCYDHKPLLGSKGEWALYASGSHTGRVDEAATQSAHAGEFLATYRLAKDGRCGLVELGLDFDIKFSRHF